VSEANESQTSYFVEQTDIFQYQSYSHSDDIFIILKSTINTDTSIFVHVFSLEKLHDSKYWKYTSLKP
jgi:excinuclease UvrABC helicase subunit UvrB